MNTTQLAQTGASVGVSTGIAISGTVGLPVIVGGAIGLVAIGGLCAVAGMIATNSSQGEMSINRNGFSGSYKK